MELLVVNINRSIEPQLSLHGLTLTMYLSAYSILQACFSTSVSNTQKEVSLVPGIGRSESSSLLSIRYADRREVIKERRFMRGKKAKQVRKFMAEHVEQGHTVRPLYTRLKKVAKG